jgi:predicted amidophosphoribosyltransferase
MSAKDNLNPHQFGAGDHCRSCGGDVPLDPKTRVCDDCEEELSGRVFNEDTGEYHEGKS